MLVVPAFFSPCSDAFTCPQNGPGVKIFFVNGVNTIKPNALLAGKRLLGEVTQHIRSTSEGMPFRSQCLDFDLAYNQNEVLFLDFFDAFRQRFKEREVDFWRSISRVTIAPDSFQALAEEQAQAVDLNLYVDDLDLSDHVNKYSKEILAGKLVIVVAHSQGNLYANEAHSVLSLTAVGSEKLKIVAVGTPASFVAGTGLYTTVEEDFIWKLSPDALEANLSNKGCGLPWACHEFEYSYLGEFPSRPQILDHVLSVMGESLGSIKIDATLDGSPWSGPLMYEVDGPAGQMALSSVPFSLDGSVTGQYSVVYMSEGPGNSALVEVSPAVVQTLRAGQDLSFTLRFRSLSNQPPTAGFSMSVPGQVATEGGTLNLIVAPDELISVQFSADRSSDPDGSIANWEWRINGTLVSSIASFSLGLNAGIHFVSLVVTDNLGVPSPAAQGTVIVTEQNPVSQYNLIDLGTFGGTSSRASAINRAGQIVGTATRSDEMERAFLWSNGVMQDLGLPVGFQRSLAESINNLGQAVGTSLFPIRATLWTNGGATDLGLLNGEQDSVALGINDVGQVVGYSSTFGGSANVGRATLWSNGSIIDLGRLPTHGSSAAYAINNAGQIVGESTFGGVGLPGRAVMWSNGTIQDLGGLPSFPNSIAFGLNSFGDAVGFAYLSGGTSRAVLWKNGTITDLGLPQNPNYGHSHAFGINRLGQVVGSASGFGGSGIPTHAVLFVGGTVYDLNDLIPAALGLELTEARSINDSGQIVGWGTYKGQPRAFLLNPPTIPGTTNIFDRTSGINVYFGGLNDANWIGAMFGVNPNSGSEFLASAIGSMSPGIQDVGISKNFGGVIEDRPYVVSFYITKYLGLSGVEFADFSSLRMGGLSGTMLWNTTPTPIVDAQWVQWTGLYTPSPADVGQPFIFQAIFDLDGQHSIGIDGPMVVQPR